jgi:phasin family protein
LKLCQQPAGKPRLEEEEGMAESLLDQFKEFGSRLGLPKVDVDKLIDLQLKNIDAIAQSAHVAGEGAKTLAAKQRDIIDAAFRQTSDMVREFRPTGDPQEILAKQKDYAKKAFELTMQNTRDLADLTKKTTSDATTIIRERLQSSLTELRDSVARMVRGS